MEKLYTVRKIRPAVDCCSYHELLIWKFRIKLRKSGKTIRLSNHNQNGKPIIIKILYDYTVEVMNRCKGLELGGGVHEELWKEVPNTVRRQWLKLSIPNKKKCRKPKWLSEEALQILKLRKGEKWKVTRTFGAWGSLWGAVTFLEKSKNREVVLRFKSCLLVLLSLTWLHVSFQGRGPSRQ